jgi:hypothetical protein
MMRSLMAAGVEPDCSVRHNGGTKLWSYTVRQQRPSSAMKLGRALPGRGITVRAMTVTGGHGPFWRVERFGQPLDCQLEYQFS